MKKPIITEEEKQKIKEMDSIRKKMGIYGIITSFG